MNNKKIAFIGVGNMAGAIISSVISSKIADAENIILFDKLRGKCDAFLKSGASAASNAAEAVKNADFIFLSVKPQNMEELISEIASANLDLNGKVFISIMAGITIQSILTHLRQNAAVIRTIPNTPLMIGQGVTGICRNEYVSDDDFSFARRIFESGGMAVEMPESEINRITAVTSSAPAYVYLFIKSMLDSAREMGLQHDEMLEMICRTFIGSANMILSTGKSPDELIKMVKSPNGTTERALNVFEQRDIEKIISEAMEACAKRADELASRS